MYIRKIMLIGVAGLAIGTGLTNTIAQEDSASLGVIYFDHVKMDAAFAKGHTLIGGRSGQAEYSVVTAQNEGPNEAESHVLDTDITYVMGGTATIVTGGTLVAPRTTAPGETRARSIQGGETRSLNKGDLIIIPRGVPHWLKKVQPPFLRFIVKVH
jgi:hypothetical protein